MKWAGFGAHDSLGVVRGVNSSERESDRSYRGTAIDTLSINLT